jgi:Fe2+ transport system protein FeoA
MIPLELLCHGEWAEIADVLGESSWVGRLAELGLRAGSRFQMIQPGSPCLLQLGNARLSVRTDGAMSVWVRLVGIAD